VIKNTRTEDVEMMEEDKASTSASSNEPES
jgi:hypothetical protein